MTVIGMFSRVERRLVRDDDGDDWKTSARSTASRRRTETGCADRFRGSWHDAPHELDAAIRDEAYAWLERWL